MKTHRSESESEVPTQPCIGCGRETSKTVGGVWICDDCYVARGSCCQEFGGDDLTESE